MVPYVSGRSIRDIVAGPSRFDRALVEIGEPLAKVAAGLVRFLPAPYRWLKGPLKGLSDRIARRRFQHLVGDVVKYVLSPDVPQYGLFDLRHVFDIAKLHGHEINRAQAEEVLSCVGRVLGDPDVEQAFTDHDLRRHLLYARHRFEVAQRLPVRRIDATEALVFAKAYRDVLEVLVKGERTERDYVGVLEFLVNVIAMNTENPRQTIDANYMRPEDPTQEVWKTCGLQKESNHLFRDTNRDDVSKILVVSHSTNPSYVGFWVPVFGMDSLSLPGAPSAYRSLNPRAVFTREPDGFGLNVPPELVEKTKNYLASVPFQVFLSFPVKGNDGVAGVVNVNLSDLEVMFTDENEVQRLFVKISPILSVLGMLDGG